MIRIFNKQTFRQFYIIVLCFASVFLGSCREIHTADAAHKSGSLSPSRKLIIDSDAGADDISAIFLAASDPNIELLGVTVLIGNVDLEQSAKNTLMALE